MRKDFLLEQGNYSGWGKRNATSMLWHLNVSLLKHSFFIHTGEAVIQPGAVTSPRWVQDMSMCYLEEGTCPCELVAHVQDEWLEQTLAVTRAQRDPWSSWLPRVGARGDLSTSTASPSVWGHEGRSSPSCVAALSWGQTHVLPMSWHCQCRCKSSLASADWSPSHPWCHGEQSRAVPVIKQTPLCTISPAAPLFCPHLSPGTFSPS